MQTNGKFEVKIKSLDVHQCDDSSNIGLTLKATTIMPYVDVRSQIETGNSNTDVRPINLNGNELFSAKYSLETIKRQINLAVGRRWWK